MSALVPKNIDTDTNLWLVKDYGIDDEPKLDDLKEVFVVVYRVKRKIKDQTEEIYSFTTSFEQAFKRFKLLPSACVFLKRYFTDDEKLIKLAEDGTTCFDGVEIHEDIEEKTMSEIIEMCKTDVENLDITHNSDTEVSDDINPPDPPPTPHIVKEECEIKND